MMRRAGFLSGAVAVCAVPLLWPAAFAAQSAAGAKAQPQPVSQANTGGDVISGTVSNAKSGLPLDGVTLTLSNERDRKQIAETTSDGEGHFSFANLSDGRYALHGSHRGFTASAYEQHEGGISTAIVTGGELVTTGLEFKLEPQATIYGVVSDDSGDPVPRARITVFRKDPSSETGRMQRANQASADEMGNFEITRLAQGNYYLAVSGRPWYAPQMAQFVVRATQGAGNAPRSALDVAYPTTYYPDVTDSGAAAPFTVGPGDRTEIDLVMHPVPAVHIVIQVASPQPNQTYPNLQLHQDIFGVDEFIPTPITFSRRDSNDPNSMMTMEYGGVAPGQYDLEIVGGNGRTGSHAQVSASTGNTNVDLSSAVALAELSGKVNVDGVDGPAEGTAVVLVPQLGGGQEAARVEKDGTFHLNSVRPGVYRVSVNMPGHPRSVVQLTATGATVNGETVKIGSDPVNLTVTAAESTASLHGFATLDGKPVSGVFVVMVPTGLSAGQVATRPNQSDSDGSFEFAGVAPGSYTVVAIEEGWVLDWGRQEVMARYLAKGVKVTVSLHTKEIDLKDPVEVQAR